MDINLNSIEAPVLVIHCIHYEIVPHEEGEQLCSLLKNSTIQLLDNCSHLPHEETPEATLEIMLRFLGIGAEENLVRSSAHGKRDLKLADKNLRALFASYLLSASLLIPLYIIPR